MKNHQLAIERYQVYKDSGVEWLGQVPNHWSLSRIKSLTKTKSGTTPQSGLSQYYDNGIYFWVRTTDLNNNKLYSSEFKITDLAREHYNLISIPIGSVLVAMYGGMGTIGKNAILQEEVTINQSVCAIFPNNKKFVSEYLWYYIQYFRPHWEIFADSARKDPNINQEAIKRLWVTFPPISEQKTIAHYLYTKTAQIDRKIDLLTQKATRYGNLKQSLINETVTRGRDRSVPMKDSAIEWIGEVPEHWGIKRVKEIFIESKNKVGSESSLYKVLSLTMKGVVVRDLENNKGKIPASFDGYQMVQKDNIVFCLFDIDVTPRIVGYVEQKGIITSAYTIVKSKGSINMKYFYYYFLEQNRNKSLLSISKTLRSTLNFDNFSLIELPIPPLSEQKAIADYLDTKTTQIDQIIQTINTQIEKLKELRKTLINDVVTGKIKVTED